MGSCPLAQAGSSWLNVASTPAASQYGKPFSPVARPKMMPDSARSELIYSPIRIEGKYQIAALDW